MRDNHPPVHLVFALNNSASRPEAWPGSGGPSAASVGRMNRRAAKGNCCAGQDGGFPDISSTRPPGRKACSVAPVPAQGKKALSALEIGVDHLGHVFNRQSARVGGSIDEKGRG